MVYRHLKSQKHVTAISRLCSCIPCFCAFLCVSFANRRRDHKSIAMMNKYYVMHALPDVPPFKSKIDISDRFNDYSVNAASKRPARCNFSTVPLQLSFQWQYTTCTATCTTTEASALQCFDYDMIYILDHFLLYVLKQLPVLACLQLQAFTLWYPSVYSRLCWQTSNNVAIIVLLGLIFM